MMKNSQFDSLQSSTEKCNIDTPVCIKIVESEDERFKAMLIRAIVYMHEQQCPFNEEFDLNDHTATQIIGMTNSGEPILTARLRYFNNFAKIERLAIRQEYRGTGLSHQLLHFLLDLCRKKGFSSFYVHAQFRLKKFYEGHGFRVVGGGFAFSDHDYLEMLLEEHAGPSQPKAHIGRDPMLINRPENNVDEIGPLELSDDRRSEVEPLMMEAASA